MLGGFSLYSGRVNLGEMRAFVREALAEDENTLMSSRLDRQFKLATLWALQAHDWPFLNVTVEDLSEDSLEGTVFRRITQVYDTKHDVVIEPTTTEKALFYYQAYTSIGDRPVVWTINQSGAEVTGGVLLRFWPALDDTAEERFIVTGTLMPEEWPPDTAVVTDVPSLVHGSITVTLPPILHSVIVQKATAAVAQQEQIGPLAQFYAAEAYNALRDAKKALIPVSSGRLVVGSDAYSVGRLGLGRRPWR